MTSIQEQTNGACQCQHVSFTITEPPLLTYACHCTKCQKRTGSAFSLGMILSIDSLTLEGTLREWQRQSDQGHTNTRFSCHSCGNVIYGVGSDMPGLIKLQVGLLQNSQHYSPDVHIWTRSAHKWIRFPDDALVYETQPDNPMQIFEQLQKSQNTT